MINFNLLIEEFKVYLRLRYYESLTIYNHSRRLLQFVEYMKTYPITDITDIQEDHILEYRKYRYHYQNKFNQQDSIEIQNRHLITVKLFFKFLKADNYIAIDPTRKESYARWPKRLPKPALTNNEIKQLFSSIDTSNLIGYRNRTIFEVFYSAGIRRQELINLNLEDIDFEESLIRINQGKGSKDRVVPLGKIAGKYLETYIKGIRPFMKVANETKALFISQRGNRLSKNALGDMVHKWAGQSNINKHITAHTFRRSCATEMIKNNANLMHVKELLGHSSLETVKVYCDLSIIDLKAAHSKYHPREKDIK